MQPDTCARHCMPIRGPSPSDSALEIVIDSMRGLRTRAPRALSRGDLGYLRPSLTTSMQSSPANLIETVECPVRRDGPRPAAISCYGPEILVFGRYFLVQPMYCSYTAFVRTISGSCSYTSGKADGSPWWVTIDDLTATAGRTRGCHHERLTLRVWCALVVWLPLWSGQSVR